MVNVNKNIVPGKKAESSAKTEPQAPTRRPRNQALNSSKKLPESVKDRRKQKLNCSREEVINQLVNEEQIYTQEEAEQLIDAFEEKTGATVERLATTDEVDNYDGEFWATKDGVTQLWCREDDGWYVKEDDYDSDGSLGVELADKGNLDSACGDKADVDSSLNCESGSAKISGTVTIYNDFADLDNDTTERLLRSRIEKAVPGAKVDFEKVNDTDVKVKIDCPDADAEKARLAVESSDVTKSVDWESATKELDSAKDADKTAEGTTLNSSTEPEGDADGGESVAEGVDASDIKITTESGNEVSMQDIKIVQNPDTNELAIFIPEDEDETIPEGFAVIGMVVPDAIDSVPAIESGVCPECGQDPCVCEGTEEAEGEDIDSSKKKKSNVESTGDGLYMYHGYTIEQSESGDSFLINYEGEYYDFDSLDDAVEFIDESEKLLYGSDYDDYVSQFDSSKKTDLNCDSSEGDCFAVLWSAYIDDSYKCACCGKSFPAGHNSVHLDGHKPDGMHFIYKYTKDNRVGNSVNYDPYNLPPEDAEGGIFKVVVGEDADDEGYRWLNFCRNCWPKLTSKSPEEIYAEYSASEKTNEGSVDSSLGADDFDDIDSSLNCAISEVAVPENFARSKSKVVDLKNIIEGELANQGFDVTVHQVARPNATTIRVGFDGPDDQVVGIDGLIEDIVAQLTQDDLFNMDSSVNCSMGGGDDRQDATSQVTVPKSFPDDKVHDLYRWVETELQHEGIDVDVYGVGRPSASTISFSFEVTGRDPADVDAIIEDRVKEFISNGNTAIEYQEGDPRSELNSDKQEKNLNCTVENARVEQTEQGTWVVRADTDRFGKDAILYEHYSEEGANKYLDKLKKGGDLVANGGESHIDLDSSEGTEEAKLDKASIEKAMLKVLKEDKDTPLVFINLDNGVKAYIQPAGYEDNALVADGKFDEANLYVAMYDDNYKPILVDGKMEKKMPGAEVVDHIKRMLGA